MLYQAQKNLMIRVFLFLILLCSFLLFCCLNPVKMGFLLVVFSLLNFIVIFFSSGSSWFPLIFSLLFIGGVIVLFIVISSLFPNEKTDNYFFFFIIFFLFLFISLFSFFCHSFISTQEFKIFLFSGFNFIFMMALVLGYFFLFLFFVSFEKASLRTFY